VDTAMVDATGDGPSCLAVLFLVDLVYPYSLQNVERAGLPRDD
jgi:hypothetical protein